MHQKILSGLKERILKAKSTDEIKTLLAEGELYLDASPVTRRKWKRAAELRAETLVEAAPVSHSKAVKTSGRAERRAARKGGAL